MYSYSRNLFTKNIRRFSSTIKDTRFSNINHTDCLRFAFVYGGCGTVASYLQMSYKDSILTFEWTPPTPERFVFCTWCWAMGGMTSWLLFWTRPQALLLASSSAISYGLFNGVKTSLLSMGCAAAMLSVWSVYFDGIEYRDEYRKWQERQGTSPHRQLSPHMMSFSSQSDSMQASSVIDIIEEEDEPEMEESDEDEADDGKLTLREKKRKSKELLNPDQKPVWYWEDSFANMKLPTSTFLSTHAAIWLVCGGLTGMLSIRLIMASTLAGEASVAAMLPFLTGVATKNKNKDKDDDQEDDD